MKHYGIVDKAWGYENIVISTDAYCGKFLTFDAGSKFSMHFHSKKDETWYVMSGKFIVEYIDTRTSQIHAVELNPEDTWHNPVLLPHRLICIEAGTILEVSTEDSIADNYRVMPGDSQKEL